MLRTSSEWVVDEGQPSMFEWSWTIRDVGQASIRVDRDRGARLTSLAVNAVELLAQTGPSSGSSPFAGGFFAMAPYAGRIDGGHFRWRDESHQLPLSAPPHAAHGLTADLPWAMSSPGVFETPLDDRWPFGGWVRQEVQCLRDGLRLVLSIGNDNRSMPVSAGFHPWFRRDLRGTIAILEWDAPLVYAETIPQITGRELVPREPSLSTWCAPASAVQPRLVWPGWLEVTLVSEQARCWVIHEGIGRTLCIEPQSAPGNALRVGDAEEVSPGRPLQFEFRLVLKSLAADSRLAVEACRSQPRDAGAVLEQPTREPGLLRPRGRDEQCVKVSAAEGDTCHVGYGDLEGTIQGTRCVVSPHLTRPPEGDPDTPFAVHGESVRVGDRDGRTSRASGNGSGKGIGVIKNRAIRAGVHTVRRSDVLQDGGNREIGVNRIKLASAELIPVDRTYVESPVPTADSVIEGQLRRAGDRDERGDLAGPQVNRSDRALEDRQPDVRSPGNDGSHRLSDPKALDIAGRRINEVDLASGDVHQPEPARCRIPYRAFAQFATEMTNDPG